MFKQVKGFTLLELVIVVTIIGIIAAVAVPSYTNYMDRTRRATAQADLMELAQWMERRYAANFNYTTTTADLPFNTSPQGSGTAFYDITVNADQTTYTLTATPTGPQTGDPCGALTLDQVGAKGDNGGGINCW